LGRSNGGPSKTGPKRGSNITTARIKTEFPHKIREIENAWIPLADGARLAARIWLPQDAERQPVPALLEYLPYRKDDHTSIRDALRHPYLAGHGYACLRVDIRGSGDSDGVLYDEYLAQEQDDALEVIAWIAAQPWCDGNVGMFGISWGGFNSLQVAARRPPALKAIIAVDFTDDRYADDVHYMGGCMLTATMLPWAAFMFTLNASPPDPAHVGERWRAMWLERLDKNTPWVEPWLRHQRRDAYWRHGSVGEDYGAIAIPVYLVGGWADSYNNSIPRLLTGLSGPRKALIGPWAHTYPEQGIPGPAIGFLQESLRWWDYWLKGIDTGIMAEPMLRSWIQDSVPPATWYETRPGRWVADPAWPSPYVTGQDYYLNSNGAAQTLDKAAGPEHRLTFKGLQSHGLRCGEWGSYGGRGELAPDQRPADGEALTFTSAPLAEAVEILGRPEVELTVAADQPLALLGVRLCDVAPTGASILVTYGLLNLAHRDGSAEPTPLETGRLYRVSVPLNMIGYRLPAGHRWRVAVSPTYIRHAWPSPRPVTLTLQTGTGSRLHLPVRTPRPADANLPSFAPVETSAPMPIEELRPAGRRHILQTDLVSGTTELTIISDDGHMRRPDNGLEWEGLATETFTICEDDPLSAAQRLQCYLSYRRAGWQVRLETDSRLTCNADNFYLAHTLAAYEGESEVFSKSWQTAIPRDHL
jgi:hypothetical protein